MHVTFRQLGRDECSRLGEIDRGESIREEYVVVDGVLELRPCHIDAPGWHPDHLAELIDRLREIVDASGVVLGALSADRLVGLGALDTRPVGADGAVMELAVLHVDRALRGQGLGGRLVAALMSEAATRGATTLYISATPTRATVDAYLRMGAHLAPTPDAGHLAAEPLDIHLLLPCPPRADPTPV